MTKENSKKVETSTAGKIERAKLELLKDLKKSFIGVYPEYYSEIIDEWIEDLEERLDG